jgi:hypothetical protein
MRLVTAKSNRRHRCGTNPQSAAQPRAPAPLPLCKSDAYVFDLPVCKLGARYLSLTLRDRLVLAPPLLRKGENHEETDNDLNDPKHRPVNHSLAPERRRLGA